MTVAHVYTVAFQGIEAREVDVQVHLSDAPNGHFNIVGLADKAVAESRERVRSALFRHRPRAAIQAGGGEPLAPWPDLPKEGSHYDLPIALGLLAVMGVLPASEMARYVALGELSLDAQLIAVAGVLPARHRGERTAPRAHLPRRLRRGGGMGGRGRDHRRAVVDRTRQSCEGRAGAESTVREDRRRARHRARHERREGSQETAKRALEIAAMPAGTIC